MKLKDEITTELKATILLNRAAAHLQLKNHGWAKRNCIDVLKEHPQNIEAYYRAAKACIELNKPEYAKGFNEKALEIQKNNKTLETQRQEICKLEVQAHKTS
jgi:Tfp pilus assembly protein PilF